MDKENRWSNALTNLARDVANQSTDSEKEWRPLAAGKLSTDAAAQEEKL